MKWRRLFWAMLGGAVLGYVLVQSKAKGLSPEEVIRSLKERYKGNLAVTGSWIYVEPQMEEIDGLTSQVYLCGLIGIKDGNPQNLLFKVDAKTGKILSVKRSKATA